MFAIAFMGVILHELPGVQFRAVVTAMKEEAGEDCLAVCNASGLFASAPRLAEHVELIFDSGIELIFLGEQAIARNSGRSELGKTNLSLLRPLNMGSDHHGQSTKLMSVADEKIWLVSTADQSLRTPVGSVHDCLDEFFRNKTDDFPVFINANGKDIEYKKALAWRYSDMGFSVSVVGTGLNCQCGAAVIDQRGNLFLTDVGIVTADRSIAGVAPEIWWKKNIDKIPVQASPDSSPIRGDFCVCWYENGKVVRFSKKSVIV